jgi:hypothetical protein
MVVNMELILWSAEDVFRTQGIIPYFDAQTSYGPIFTSWYLLKGATTSSTLEKIAQVAKNMMMQR